MEAQVKKVKSKNSEVKDKLNQLLADYQLYYQNLRGLHWNVKGSMFFMLHEKFEEYYNEAADAVDEIAERILMIGGTPLHTFSDYIKYASIQETENVSDGKEAVYVTLDNSKHLLNRFNEVLEVAEKAGDEATSALMSDFISAAEKRIWMLSSVLA
ncbi:MAG: DNA starvation/stationary phase protection protein [Prolixibacteraceae bacterium]|nr:DNA starvation/stationary phase protection protein [Prolixibacteraceae bacterium]